LANLGSCLGNYILKAGVVLIVCISLSFSLTGQIKNFDVVFKDYAITVKAGPSIVIAEFKNDLSGIINEMRHLPKYSFSVGASKLLFENWEIGYEFEYSSFQGFQNNPDFSAYRFGHYMISLMRIEPVIYRSNVINNDAIFTYHFNKNVKKRVVPFIYIKGGTTRLSSRLLYKSNKELIFAKTGWDPKEPKSSIFVSNYNAGVGFGYEYIISSKLSLNAQAEFSLVNDDNLDGVHNFNAPPPEGYKNFVSGLYGRIMISATYIINPNRYRVAARTYRLKDSFNNKAQERQIFPWSHKK
jgi:hypothetical protein